MLLRINTVRPLINFAVNNKMFTPSSLTLDVKHVSLLLYCVCWVWTEGQVSAWSWSMRYSAAMICVHLPILLLMKYVKTGFSNRKDVIFQVKNVECVAKHWSVWS